jgi:hypothetical protein
MREAHGRISNAHSLVSSALMAAALSLPAGQEEGTEGFLDLRASSGTYSHGLLCHAFDTAGCP